MASIDNYEDVIDSRCIVDRVEEIKAARDQAAADGMPADAAIDEDEARELELLEALLEQLRNVGGDSPEDGRTLVRDSYFEDYAREFAEDVGYMNNDQAHNWPFTCIDWEQAAEELQQDYTSVDYDGVDYWVR